MVHAHAVQCFAPDVAYTDAKKYLPALLEKRGVAPESAIAVLDSLVPLIPIVDAEIYGDTQAAALQRIGARDADDWSCPGMCYGNRMPDLDGGCGFLRDGGGDLDDRSNPILFELGPT
nr:PIN domain-containing protein [Mycetohabitans sp. B7]